MNGLGQLIRRDCKLFFKDKGLFFSSLISPLILLVLYATFLGRIYRDSFTSALPEGLSFNPALLDATVAGQLISSLLAVCCVTVAVCANLQMVSDKVSGARRDLAVSPVRSSTVSLAYFCASSLVTLIVNFVALGASLAYLALGGCWYMTVQDVLLLVLDVFLLTLFGVSLSSCLYAYLTTNGQASAIGTIISTTYGFICGAYMPISNYPDGLRKVLSFLPGTYGTCLLRNHALAGVYDSMADEGLPAEFVDGIRESIDCSLTFFGHPVSVGVMYAVLIGAILLLTGVYVLMSSARRQRR